MFNYYYIVNMARVSMCPAKRLLETLLINKVLRKFSVKQTLYVPVNRAINNVDGKHTAEGDVIEQMPNRKSSSPRPSVSSRLRRITDNPPVNRAVNNIEEKHTVEADVIDQMPNRTSSSHRHSMSSRLRRIADSPPVNREVNNFDEKHAVEADVTDQMPNRTSSSLRHSMSSRLKRLVDNPDTFGTLTSDLENVDRDTAEEIETGNQFETFKVIHRRRSQQYYLNLIEKYIQQKNLKEALSVLENKMLKEDRAKPEYLIYTVLIAACARVGYSKKAFQLYNQMKKRGLKVTAATYTSLFNACANSPFLNDSLKRAVNLRQLMVEKGIQPNALNYHAMIKAFGRCGDFTTTLNIFEEMVTMRHAVKVDTLNNLLQACISDKNAGFHHAILVWRKLLQMKVTPDVDSYNLVVRAARDCNLGGTESAQGLLEKIAEEERMYLSNSKKFCARSGGTKRIGVSSSHDETAGPVDQAQWMSSSHDETAGPVDVPTISQMSDEIMKENTKSNNVACASTIAFSQGVADEQFHEDIVVGQSCPNLLTAQPHLGNVISLKEITKPEDRLLLLGGFDGVLDHMASMDVTPNVKTFTLLLDCIPETPAAEHELISAMKRSDVKPDIDFFNMLIRRRNLRADYEAGREVLTLIHQAKLIPNVMTFGVLAIGCENEEDANALMENMQSVGYRMNAEILGAMLRNACIQLNFSYVETVMEVMKKEEISPNLKFLETLEKFKSRCEKVLRSKTGLPSDENRTMFQKNFNNFKQNYEVWLKTAEPEMEQHPWKQYRE